LTEVSTRYVPHIVALIVLAAVPTLLHATGRFDVDDCGASALLLAPPPAAEQALLTTQERRRFDQFWGAGNWVSGSLPHNGAGGRLSYVIARAFDPKTVYHWPEARVLPGTRPVGHGSEDASFDGVQLPVHRAFYDPDVASASRPVVAYLLVYGGRPVRNPYLAQVLSGPLQVVRGRHPMWLYIVYGQVAEAHLQEAERRAQAWLASAWSRHQEVCGR
jgi:hypothetical protein